MFTATEIHSRQEILLENYSKVIHIEALTMLDMASRDILPAIMKYVSFLTDSALKKAQLGIKVNIERDLAEKLSEKTQMILERIDRLNAGVEAAAQAEGTLEEAVANREQVVSAMEALRAVVDETELLVPTEYWPYPAYGEMLFGIR